MQNAKIDTGSDIDNYLHKYAHMQDPASLHGCEIEIQENRYFQNEWSFWDDKSKNNLYHKSSHGQNDGFVNHGW